MSVIVQKFGGTSLAGIERIKAVAERVAKCKASGQNVVVVVSAMAGETDRLLKLAGEVCSDPQERELDLLLSSGERIPCALLAMALKEQGFKAVALTGRQVGILTDSSHTQARIERISADRLKEILEAGTIPVIAGFQGINQKSDVTTLGRGGSDLTAVAISMALNAERCDIYTDVEGIYTADPAIVPEARKLEKISYEEMLEMASLGAKVLQTRSVEFAAKYEVPIRVLSSFTDGTGTLVTKEDREMEQVVVSGVTYDKNQSKITITEVPDRPGIAARLFGVICDKNINVDMILQNVSQPGRKGSGQPEGSTDISFTVSREDAEKAVKISGKIAAEIGAQGVELKEDIAKVSVVGVGMRSHSGVAAKMFQILSGEGINIMMISTSEIKISCVIDAKYTELAVRSLHDSFELAKA